MVVFVLAAIDQIVLLHWSEQRLVSLLFVVVSAHATIGGSPVEASVHRSSSLAAAANEERMEKGGKRENEEGRRGEESDVSSYSYWRWRTKMGGCLIGDSGHRRDEEKEKRVGCGGCREKKNEEFRFGSFGLRISESTWRVAKRSHFTFCSSVLSPEEEDQVGKKKRAVGASPSSSAKQYHTAQWPR
ncbi:hypothetical protein H5410_002331, partial [Solanum commersonii]